MSLIDYRYMSSGLTVIPFQLLDHAKLFEILRVRNDKRVRFWMDSQQEITPEDHFKFCRSLQYRDDVLYCAVEADEVLLGVIYLTGIDLDSGVAELGLYRNPNIDGRNIGALLMAGLEDTSRRIGVKTLFLRVRLNNERAIALYQRLGYTTTDWNDTYLYMNKEVSS